MNDCVIEPAVPWAPHPSAAPVTEKSGSRFIIRANGMRTCVGGWQFTVRGLTPGAAYRIDVPVAVSGVAYANESVRCLCIWGEIPPDESDIGAQADNDTLLFHDADGLSRFSRVLVMPEQASCLTIRFIFRWSTTGEAVFGLPVLTPAVAPLQRTVRISVVTGSQAKRSALNVGAIADNVKFYGDMCERALAEKPDLIVLPEIALQWGVPGHQLNRALTLDCEELKYFQSIAARGAACILVPMYEKDGDAVFNSAILAGGDGVIGVYRKVHLAEYGETNSGVTPGDAFPVFETPKARVGAIICMDSSAAESTRMLGLNGAEIIMLPIMGDHRADRFTRGTPEFSEDRWKAIMRTRALDNQCVMAVARNNAQGSCIIDPRGDIVAWNDGGEDIISAEVALDPVYRKWNGARQRDIVWLQRRPQLYGAFTETEPPAVRGLTGR